MNGRLLAPSGLVALVALLLVLPFAPAAHGSVTQAECTGTTLGGSRVAWDSGKCVLLDRLLIMVAGDLDNAATQLETRSGWTAEKKLPLVKVILAKYTGSQNLDLAGIKAEMAHFSSQSWAAIVELDALASAAQLAPAVATTVAADKFPTFVGGSVSDQDYTQYAPVDSWTLPGAVDGDGDLTYTLSPELPAGLDFDGKARTISGTPASALEETRYTLTATDEDGDDTRLTFTIKVAAQVAHALSKAGGDEQQGPGGSLLAEPFVVSLLDQVGNPYAGAPVAFEVTAGGGTLSALTDTTDAEGRAAVALTLGQVPGTNTVEAVVAGLDPVIFTATAEVTPDFDGDGAIGSLDFYLFADAFGGSDPRFDLDGNGSVGLPDFFLFAESFGQPAP